MSSPLIKSRFFTKNNKESPVITIEYEVDPKNSNDIKEISNTNKQSKRKLQIESEDTTITTKKQESLAKIQYKEVFERITKIRSEIKAPVDEMGADSFDIKEINEKDRRFHILCGCLLSSQTKDQITHAAMVKLKQYGLTVDNVLKTDNEKLEELIKPVGFYKRKAEYMKKIAKILKDKYQGDIPSTFSEIMELPGIGPKMTFLILQIAWKRVEGIAVDVHMHRICNRLGWTISKTPEDTRKSLESWLPREYWHNVNHLLVGFGQTVCLPINPKCAQCTVNNLCPTGIQNLKTPVSKGKKKSKKPEEEEYQELEEQEIIQETSVKKKTKSQ